MPVLSFFGHRLERALCPSTSATRGEGRIISAAGFGPAPSLFASLCPCMCPLWLDCGCPIILCPPSGSASVCCSLHSRSPLKSFSPSTSSVSLLSVLLCVWLAHKHRDTLVLVPISQSHSLQHIIAPRSPCVLVGLLDVAAVFASTNPYH